MWYLQNKTENQIEDIVLQTVLFWTHEKFLVAFLLKSVWALGSCVIQYFQCLLEMYIINMSEMLEDAYSCGPFSSTPPKSKATPKGRLWEKEKKKKTWMKMITK